MRHLTALANRVFDDSQSYEFLNGQAWSFVILFCGKVNVPLRAGRPTHTEGD